MTDSYNVNTGLYSESQKELLDMLVDFDFFCRCNNIKYSLSGGTLIGAIRHKGFIPWDDDADIMFDRNNYNRFLTIFKQNNDGRYKITSNYWIMRISKSQNDVSKVEKQCIDLFVFDSIPETQIMAKIKILLIHILQGMIKPHMELKEYNLKNKVLILFTHIMGSFFSLKFKQRIYGLVSKFGNSHTTNYVNVYNTYYNQVGTLRYPREILDNYQDVEFCGKKLMAIGGYHTYLSILYGDYMTPPEEDKRVALHTARGK